MKHFTIDEFACPCCGRDEMEADFLAMIDNAREIAGVPMSINSGFRCPAHNAEVGGSETSSHLYGLAADIKITNSPDRYKILCGLIMAGFRRIGIAETFIHVDTDSEKAGGVVWVY